MATRNSSAATAPAPQQSMPPPPPPPMQTQAPAPVHTAPTAPPPPLAPPPPPQMAAPQQEAAVAAAPQAPQMPPPPAMPAMAPPLPTSQVQEAVPVPPAQFQPPIAPPEQSPVSPLPPLMQGLNVGNAIANAGGAAMNDIDFSQFDLTGVQSGFRVLPDNITYEWEIKAVEVTTSKTGNRMMKLTLESCFPEEYEGTKVWDYVVVTPDTMWKVMSLAQACGYLSEDRKRITAPSAQAFVGHVVRAGIINEDYQGRTGNKIKGAYEEAYETPGLETSAPTIG